jgi:MFS superfamily sulfate permease-like transporter
VDKKDFLLWLAASIFTLFLGIEIGVLVGVGLSLAFVIYESANPHMGKPFSTYRQTWMLDSTVMCQITN